MIKIIAIFAVIVLILGGIIYFRYITSKSNLTAPSTSTKQVDQEPIEVPKTLPEASLEDRVKTLEDVVAKLVTQVNSLKSQSTTTQSTSSNSSLSSLGTSVTELKARVSSLESKSTSTTTSGATTYIPLGSGGVYTNTDWMSLSEYEVSLDPANFPGYSGMTLEATFRLDDPSGTASVRLYNVTDGSAISSQLDSTSTSYTLKTSSSFKLATGTKTYRLQARSTSGKNLFLQTARLKVSY